MGKRTRLLVLRHTSSLFLLSLSPVHTHTYIYISANKDHSLTHSLTHNPPMPGLHRHHQHAHYLALSPHRQCHFYWYPQPPYPSSQHSLSITLKSSLPTIMVIVPSSSRERMAE